MFKTLYSNRVKRIAVLLLTGFIFSGCNFLFDQNKDQVINPIDQNGQIQGEDSSKIIVWGLFETAENIEPLFTRFEENVAASEAGESIDAVYVKKESDEYLSELDEVLNDSNPNTSPDVFMIHSSWLRKYENKILNIPDDILPANTIENEFHEFLSDIIVNNDQVIGVPLWVDSLAMVYNSDHLLEKAGATNISNDWNQFLIQAQNMTQYDENGNVTRAGFSAGNSENVEFAEEVLDMLFLQARNRPIEESDKIIPYTSDEISQIQTVLDWYKSFATGEDKTWSNNFKLDTALFIEGKLSAVILPSWRILDIQAYKDQYNLDLNYSVAQVPQLNPNTTDAVYYPTFWIYVVSSDTANSNNAFKLLEFITRETEQQYYIDTVNQNGREFALLSPNKSIAETQSNENEYLQPYYNSFGNALIWNMPDGPAVKEQYRRLLDGEINLQQLLTFVENLNEEN